MQKAFRKIHPSQAKTFLLPNIHQPFKSLNRLSQFLFSLSASVTNILPYLFPQNSHLFIILFTLYILNMASVLYCCQPAQKSTHLLTITFQLTIISCLTFAIQDHFLVSLFSAFIYPALALFFTRNISCFITCTLIQSIFIHFIEITDDGFIQNLTITSVFLALLLTLILSDFQKELAQSESQHVALLKSLKESQDLLTFLVLEIKSLINNVLETARIVAHEEASHKIANLIQTAKNLIETIVFIVNDHLLIGKTKLKNFPENELPTNMRELFEQLWRIAGESFKRFHTKGHIKIQTQVPAILKFNSQCFTYVFLDILSNNSQHNPVKILVEWVGEPSPITGVSENNTNESFSLLQVACERRIQDPYIILNHYDKEIKTKFGFNDGGFDSKGILRVIFQDLPLEYNILKHKILRKICCGWDITFINNNKTTIIEFPCVVVTPREQLKIIIADEDNESADLLAAYVEKMQGIIKGKVRNGLEAYMSFAKSVKEKEYIDAVILDLNLPIIEGKFLCKKIRAYEKEHNLAPCRIVIVAKELNYNDLNALTDHNGEYKAQCFLKKPITFEKLKDYLRE